jgi:trigger factor
MKVEYVEETSVRKALHFEIEADIVGREIEARAKDFAKKVRIPGFRPGKIPTHVVRQRFKDEVLREAAEDIVNRVVPEELKGRGLEPLANPKVTDLKISENEPMTFRAVFETLPLVELPEYRGLEVKAPKTDVSDEDVQKEVDRLREEHARYDPIEGRSAETGDFALMDIVFKRPDGGKGGHDENVLVEVGSADNHQDLNTALVGLNAGDTKDVRLTYADDHPSERMRGSVVDYTLTLRALKKKIVPAADDDFAKDLGDLSGLAELQANIRRKLEESEARRGDRETKEGLLTALVAKANFEVPEALVDRHLDDRTEAFARRLMAQGIDPTKGTIDWQKFRDSQREEAVRSAKGDILLHEIALREAIEVTPGDLDQAIQGLAQRLNKAPEALRRQMEKEGEIQGLRNRLQEEKTLDLLKASARLELQ